MFSGRQLKKSFDLVSPLLAAGAGFVTYKALNKDVVFAKGEEDIHQHIADKIGNILKSVEKDAFSTSYNTVKRTTSDYENSADYLDEENEADEYVATSDSEDFMDDEALKKIYVNTSDAADFRLFCGTGNNLLAHSVANQLNIQVSRAKVDKYHDGEIGVRILDSVRGKDCFVMQSLCGPNPHDQLMELLLMISALRRSSSGNIVAIIPYMAYARQLDGLHTNSYYLPAAEIARMLETVGVNHVVCVDLHRPQFIGFFEKAVCENLDTTGSVIPYLEAIKGIKNRKVTLVSPIGGAKRAARMQYALTEKGCDVNLAFTYLVNKDKNTPTGSSEYKDHHEIIEKSSEHFKIVGDFQNRDAIIVDDMIDSASRVCAVAEALKEKGAKDIYAYATHGLFTGNAIDRIEKSALNEVIVFDTVPLSPAQQSSHIRQLSASGLIAETIRRIHSNQSIVNLEHRYGEYKE